ncbi:MAG: hypothetical protein IJI53_09735 [Clostridia bacterium]|nr:hypothetical protein [Clostridia bacterium]MBR0408303.1 hypothetical protein [Clostridia bacterium]
MGGQIDFGQVVGHDGQGVPSGGAAGQYLRKRSTSNFDAEWAALQPVLKVDCGTITSLPKTVSHAGIESDMETLRAVLSNPAAPLSDWTVSTSAGSVTISGTVSGSTTLILYLGKTRT